MLLTLGLALIVDIFLENLPLSQLRLFNFIGLCQDVKGFLFHHLKRLHD
jgi:hypothetical protein